MDDSGTPLDLKGYNLEFGRATAGTLTAGTLTSLVSSASSVVSGGTSVASASVGLYQNQFLLPLTYAKIHVVAPNATAQTPQIPMALQTVYPIYISGTVVTASTKNYSIVTRVFDRTAGGGYVSTDTIPSGPGNASTFWQSYEYFHSDLYDPNDDDFYRVLTVSRTSQYVQTFNVGNPGVLRSTTNTSSVPEVAFSNIQTLDNPTPSFDYYFGSIVIPV